MEAVRELDIEELELDGSDEDATLVYDLPARSDPPLRAAASSTLPPARSRSQAPSLGTSHFVVTVVAALVGAMAAAVSIEGKALGLPSSGEELVAAFAKLWPEDRGGRVVVTPLPEISGPSGPVNVANGASASATAPSTAATTAATATAPAATTASTADVATATAAATTATTVATTASPEPAATAAPRARPARKSALRSRSTHTEQRTGTLRINSRPWSKIFIDNRPFGSTPQMAIELPPGRHRVVLVSDEFALRRTLTVQVRAGQTVTRSVELLQ